VRSCAQALEREAKQNLETLMWLGGVGVVVIVFAAGGPIRLLLAAK
jgi:hypothetical protein